MKSQKFFFTAVAVAVVVGVFFFFFFFGFVKPRFQSAVREVKSADVAAVVQVVPDVVGTVDVHSVGAVANAVVVNDVVVDNVVV